MRALPGLDAPAMGQLLPRDPDAAGPARRSAVERLAADRAKYVRGLPGAARGPASEGSGPGADERQAGDPQPQARTPGVVARRAVPRRPLRPDSLVIYRQKCDFVRGPGADSFRGGLVKKLFPGPGKDKTSVPPETSPAGEESRARGEEAAPVEPGSAAAPAAPEPHSIPAAPPARPRVQAAPPPPARPSVQPARPVCPSIQAAPPPPVCPSVQPARPRVQAAPPPPVCPSVQPARPRVQAAPAPPPARPSVQPAHPRVQAAPPPPARPSVQPAPPARPSVLAAPGPEPRATRRGGLQRSQSDLSSRYSMSAAEFDTFFQFCGLEPEVVEALGKDNFSLGSDPVALKVRSMSIATSDSGFSRRSGGGDAGLQEEELTEQVPSTTSVIERNARIIKWLYTCKKARETPGPRLQGPV